MLIDLLLPCRAEEVARHGVFRALVTELVMGAHANRAAPTGAEQFYLPKEN
jgi:hypothetical protein